MTTVEQLGEGAVLPAPTRLPEAPAPVEAPAPAGAGPSRPHGPLTTAVETGDPAGEQPLPDQADSAKDAEPEDTEEPGPRRALAMPALRPYLPDRTTPRILAREAVATARSAHRARRAGRLAVRATAYLVRRGLRLLRDCATVLYIAAAAWCTGKVGKRFHPLVRLIAIPGGTVYALIQSPRDVQIGALIVVLAVVVLTAMAVSRKADANSEEEPVKAAEKSTEKTEEEGAGKAEKKATGKGKRTPKGGKKARPAWSLAGALESALARPAPDSPAGPSPQTPAEPSGEAPQEPPQEAPQEAPAPPSRDDLARSLHAHLRGARGVLLTTLQEAHNLPSTKAVKAALDGAGIRHREGVRAAVLDGGQVKRKNGPGVHLEDIPPLPTSREGSPVGVVAAGQEPTPTPTTPGEAPEKGLSAQGTDLPFDVVPDPERGPSAWKVIQRP
ncbi:hypothetical protein [Streptomyces sp. SM8]|uniref:hypothetical protein n=1 Tax=Streptomyces sp. SM8 TaxID=1195457 RepID=UPI0002830E76|nr:hypothetical protein [Streptomyces sp. SM8]PKA32914.1 hypothetical protein SM8_032120 [Streptomyces sp. SM8]